MTTPYDSSLLPNIVVLLLSLSTTYKLLILCGPARFQNTSSGGVLLAVVDPEATLGSEFLRLCLNSALARLAAAAVDAPLLRWLRAAGNWLLAAGCWLLLHNISATVLPNAQIERIQRTAFERRLTQPTCYYASGRAFPL